VADSIPRCRPARTLYTIGHSTRPADLLLGEQGIAALVDVRPLPD
jgi:hypothetical protein